MNNTTELAPLLTIEKLSDYLQVHTDTLRAWVKAETIPHIRISAGSKKGQRSTLRFDIDAVRAWLQTLVVSPETQGPQS